MTDTRQLDPFVCFLIDLLRFWRAQILGILEPFVQLVHPFIPLVTRNNRGRMHAEGSAGQGAP
jgi:hypothetical protein